jgi:hypothetical protein
VILSWADAWQQRTGKWPTLEAELIPESGGETWLAVSKALKKGARGLPGGRSLAEVLAAGRGVRNRSSVPRLTRQRILSWADAHFRRTGTWPTQYSGPVTESPGDTWFSVDAALRQGSRGLLGSSSLPQLLARHRGRRNLQDLPPLSLKQILSWADAHRQRTGQWPNRCTGAVREDPRENWRALDQALRTGSRRLPGGESLLQLLARKRGARNALRLGPLSQDQIVGWARLHFERMG